MFVGGGWNFSSFWMKIQVFLIFDVLLKTFVSAEVKVQAICWCLETSSSRLLLLIQVKNKNKPISDVLVLIRLNSF